MRSAVSMRLTRRGCARDVAAAGGRVARPSPRAGHVAKRGQLQVVCGQGQRSASTTKKRDKIGGPGLPPPLINDGGGGGGGGGGGDGVKKAILANLALIGVYFLLSGGGGGGGDGGWFGGGGGGCDE